MSLPSAKTASDSDQKRKLGSGFSPHPTSVSGGVRRLVGGNFLAFNYADFLLGAFLSQKLGAVNWPESMNFIKMWALSEQNEVSSCAARHATDTFPACSVDIGPLGGAVQGRFCSSPIRSLL